MGNVKAPLPDFLGCSGFPLLVDDDLVVHAELALWHSAEVALHHHAARHVRAQHLTCGNTRHALLDRCTAVH